MRDEKLNRPVTPKRSATRAAMHARRLCDSCEANQQLIYQIMSDYIRDEKDPEYQHSIETADAYKAKLHEKHPLCDACQAKIDALVAEQKAVLQQRQRDATMSSAEQIPRLPSLPVCLCRTTLWSLCHLGTFLLCLYVHYYPPQYRESDATNPVWSNFLSEVVIWYQAQPGLLPALDALVRRRLL
ncbi:hypothetical protein BCR43DRAFT_116425 [Syncephalastrum racemosum]|uniref:Ima1 N-terminal domain-containing protein n=1 Tax=Syncephalastrum racemosum TaxID=13706 RepID=A0A1X2H0I9_SYNRA|nr:hypothetical protein BCR43DRAFT_116425 [Syncephalastrum racemosum]